MSRASIIRATAQPDKLRGERKSRVAASVLPFVPTGAKLVATCSYGRSSDLRHGVAVGLLANREDSSSALIVTNGAVRSSSSIFRDSAGTVVEFDLGDLVHTTIAVFRSHPHINNVLTHICGGRWERIGQALCVIFNPLAALNDLSPLAQNIVELMCAERGITGRILKPFLHVLLDKVLPAQTAAYLRTHVCQLFLEMKATNAHPIRGCGPEPDMAIAADGPISTKVPAAAASGWSPAIRKQ